MSDIQFDIQIIWISRTFCMLFPMAGVNSIKSYLSVYVHVHTHTLSRDIFYWRIYLSQYSIFVWIKALFPQTPDCGELPSHHTWYLKESIFQVLIPEFPTSFSIHWLRWLIQLISEQTLNMEAILEERFLHWSQPTWSRSSANKVLRLS